jgi:DNA-binding CsgD family transcriptional regulator
MTPTDALQRGRESFRRQRWGEAYAQLSAADHDAPLDPADLEQWATSAFLIGRDSHSEELLERAHQQSLARGNPERAARCAFWLAFALLDRGEHARGSGWIARARRVLDDGGRDCVERGYLLLPEAIGRLAQGADASAFATFRKAAEIGDRYGDRDLVVLARHGQGRALIRQGVVLDGIRLLDEVMIAVTAGEVSPVVMGTVYCSVISACQEVFDLRRAHEWTEALSHWCETQPDLVPYRGQCLANRAEIMQLHGAWRDAMEEACRASERLADPPGQSGMAAALYCQAELHRLRGEFAEAEEAYRRAAASGRALQPGLALLRLVQGRVDVALAAIRRMADEAQERRKRPEVLAPLVEIAIAAKDTEAAQAAAQELSNLAADIDVPYLHALSSQATGAVLLEEGDAGGALTALRSARAIWEQLETPYEEARVRVLIGLACRMLGDDDGAAMELDAAAAAFRQLGAAPDRTRAEQLARGTASESTGGLTPRELQVLRLVAAGKTNRAIAADLAISEKTVARHVSNIFTKLGVSSRAAATAYAYQHDLA